MNKRLANIDALLVEQRHILVRKIICFFFLIGIFMSLHLWIPDRFFPLIPLFERGLDLPDPIQLFFLSALLISLCLGIFYAHRIHIGVLLGALVILLLLDQMRWQPWVYIYSLFLLPFLFRDNEKENEGFLAYFQIILIGVYIWSGIHKLNPNFIEFTVKDILENLFQIRNPDLIKNLSTIGYVIPFVEIFIGLGLIVPKSRKLAVMLAVSTHVFILLYLSPIGTDDNSIVYPWNIAMILLVFLLFYGTKNKLKIWNADPKLRAIGLVVIVLCWLLPTLSIFNKWDNYLSFSLYSDKVHRFFIAISDEEISKTDKRLVSFYAKIEGIEGGEIIDVNRWSMSELNVPFYPETRCFKKLAQTFCELGIAQDKLMFLEFERPVENLKFEGFYCKDL